jgi:Alw26I/Eco31I/Esp3I family type II restriction m6 adenine DNA methyltransferase
MSPDSRPFKNSNLFSNHYLEKLVKDSAPWREAEPGEAFAQIKELYQRKAHVLENYNESQLEENFIRPVLRILGHYFGVQGKVLGKDRTPDYAFFPDLESRTLAEAHPADDYYRRAVAVGDAKSWKIPLDKSRKGQGSFEMQNPSYQIDVYLRDTPPKWAILTSGRLWRLYHETTSYKLDYYYEVDLPALLAAGDLENFKYFYLFFRREAFGQTVDGGCFLDSVREESVAYAQEIGEDLKENVYRAMKILAQGFLAETAIGTAGPDQQAVARAAESSMRLLYRLLFIFYAESRGLLDTNNRYYYELSLQKLKADVAARLDRGELLLSVRYSYWENLKNLFSLINDGSESRRISREEFYIPAYNGGLFDPRKEENRFLESARIGDSFLARAIDLLARSQAVGKGLGDQKQKGFVDYSSLEIRHLGSIYEGLLEYRLRVAEQPMAAIKEKGKEQWLPAGDAGKRKILESAKAGEIYLATDKGERKATGSYYTPDYIVKYIVKNTIEPVIEKKKQEWLGTSRPFADYVLSIKVLDPAMGSGHFLVEATDQLARWLVSAWATARPEEADSKEVAEQDIHWARREVVRNCIYGVDLNPMAVELAKLSLWLTTVASNKPLSFLDHHLRCGNSLIGAELDKLTVLPGGAAEQTPLWSYGLKSHTDGLLKKYSLMAALPDDNLQMVKWKEEQFRQIRDGELSQRLAELSNVWLSTYFGNTVSDDDYYELQNHLSPEKFPDWGGLRAREWFTRAQALGREKRFFHWELEFPEAFQGEGRGFDVVVGNPPYDELSEAANGRRIDEKPYVSATRIFQEAATFRINLFRLFIALAIDKTKEDGFHGFIVPMSLLGDRFSFELRRKILSETNLECIEAFPQKDDPFDRVFLDAKLPTCIYILNRKQSSDSFKVRTHSGKYLIESSPSYYVTSDEIFKFDPKSFSIPTVDDDAWKLALKLYKNPVLCLFQEIASSSPGEIMINKQFENYLSNEPPGEIILRGANIGRYEFYEVPKQGEPVYLNKRKYLAERGNNSDSKAYDHLKNRIGYQRGSAIDNYRRVIATMLDPGVFCSDTVAYFAGAKYNLYSILALLNSSLVDWRFGLTSTTNHVNSYEIDVIPIPKFSFTTPTPERARLEAELEQLYAEDKFTEILVQVDACLPKDGEGNFIADQEKSDVVHDFLAFLAEKMLEMNKEKQQEIKGFLGWLEGYLGAKVEDLTPKTKLQSYYEHDYEGLMVVLKKNRKKLAIDPARREPAEALKAEFEGSMGKLGPLQERIGQTDELIDQVVFRLYGLTEEEIGIVEGKEAAK